MWRPIVLCVVFSGCGFQSRPGAAGDDGPPSPDGAEVVPGDAAVDAAKDAADTPNCFAAWLDGTVSLDPPVALMKVSIDLSQERDPWVSGDGLRLYFSRASGVILSDIYLVTRTDVSKDFDSAAPLSVLNTGEEESGSSLISDENLLALSRGSGSTPSVIYLTTRNQAGVFASPSKDHLGNVNADNSSHLDPFLTAGGTKLYLAPAPPPPGHQHIVVTTRTTNTEDFATPVEVEGIADGVSQDADPAVAADDRILVFSSVRSAGAGLAGTNLWYATRTDPAKAFGAPTLIPGVNSDFNDGDPMLSRNGCELYFSSRRARVHGDYDLYVAKVSMRASPLPIQR